MKNLDFQIAIIAVVAILAVSFAYIHSLRVKSDDAISTSTEVCQQEVKAICGNANMTVYDRDANRCLYTCLKEI